MDWSSVLISPPYDSLSVDRILIGFYDVLFKCFRDCVPLVNSRLEHSSVEFGIPPWNSARVSRLRNRKSKLFKKFVRSGIDIDYALYSRARTDYRRINHYCYEEYMIRDRSNFAKSFYDFVRAKRKSSSFPTEMFYGDVSSSSYFDISNKFAAFFQSTYRQLNSGPYLSSGYSYPYLRGSLPFSNIYSFD